MFLAVGGGSCIRYDRHRTHKKNSKASSCFVWSHLSTPSVCCLHSCGLLFLPLRFYFLGSCWSASAGRRDCDQNNSVPPPVCCCGIWYVGGTLIVVGGGGAPGIIPYAVWSTKHSVWGGGFGCPFRGPQVDSLSPKPALPLSTRVPRAGRLLLPRMICRPLPHCMLRPYRILLVPLLSHHSQRAFSRIPQ